VSQRGLGSHRPHGTRVGLNYSSMNGQLHALTALPLGGHFTHCTGGRLGPRVGLEGGGKSRRLRHSIPRRSSA